MGRFVWMNGFCSRFLLGSPKRNNGFRLGGFIGTAPIVGYLDGIRKRDECGIIKIGRLMWTASKIDSTEGMRWGDNKYPNESIHRNGFQYRLAWASFLIKIVTWMTWKSDVVPRRIAKQWFARNGGVAKYVHSVMTGWVTSDVFVYFTPLCSSSCEFFFLL